MIVPRGTQSGKEIDVPSRSKKKKPRTKAAKKAKVHTVMKEFKEDTLHSSAGPKVTNRKQAVAIALSEAGMSKKKAKSRKKRAK